MGMKADSVYALLKSYVDNSIKGITGVLKGKPCTIDKIELNKTTNKNEITFKWTADDGTAKTQKMVVPNGRDAEESLGLALDIDGYVCQSKIL